MKMNIKEITNLESPVALERERERERERESYSLENRNYTFKQSKTVEHNTVLDCCAKIYEKLSKNLNNKIYINSRNLLCNFT